RHGAFIGERHRQCPAAAPRPVITSGKRLTRMAVASRISARISWRCTACDAGALFHGARETRAPSGGQHPQQGIEIFWRWFEHTPTVVMHESDDLLIEWCPPPHSAALVDDVTIEVVDLGTPPAHHVLEHGGASASQALDAGRHVGQELVRSAAGGSV